VYRNLIDKTNNNTTIISVLSIKYINPYPANVKNRVSS